MNAPTTGLAARADQFDRPVNPCREIGRYLTDPEFRAQVDAEVAEYRRQVNAMFDKSRAAQEARWASEGDVL